MDSKKRNARDSLLKEIVSKVIKRTTSISHRILLSLQLARLYQCIRSKTKGQGFHFKRFLYLRHPLTRCKSAPNRAMTWSKATWTPQSTPNHSFKSQSLRKNRPLWFSTNSRSATQSISSVTRNLTRLSAQMESSWTLARSTCLMKTTLISIGSSRPNEIKHSGILYIGQVKWVL